jgi:diguanylate cyclase (GGDEF)-like protein
VAQTLLFRIEGSGNLRGILLGPTLASSDVIARIDVQRSALYGTFLGLCLALLTYNLMMWRAIRERYLLAYCAMVAMGLTYAFTSSTALAQLVPSIDNNLRLRLNYVLLAGTATTALWFVRLFFDSVPFSRRFDQVIRLCMVMIGAAALAFALFAPWQIYALDLAYTLSFVLLFFLGLTIFAKGWRSGGRAERLFVIAWLVPVLFNAARLLHSLGLISHSFWIDSATILAMGAEALLASMILAYRVRFMRADRDAARADEAEARLLADTDELTGLVNRRALMRAACPAPPQAGHYRLILIDIDHFKAINDSAGHSAGDAVLQKVAAVIRAAMRPEAIAARIGGEEFALLFPTGNVDRRYYSSLLARIRALPPVGGQRITISMGAANGWLGGSEGEWLALYRAADAALYEAKRSGRNRLIVAPRYRDLTEAA